MPIRESYNICASNILVLYGTLIDLILSREQIMVGKRVRIIMDNNKQSILPLRDHIKPCI